MALQGKLVLNDADYVTFNLHSVGVFMVHPGRDVYRDKAAYSAVVKDGPLPLGNTGLLIVMKETGFLKRDEKLRVRSIRSCHWL